VVIYIYNSQILGNFYLTPVPFFLAIILFFSLSFSAEQKLASNFVFVVMPSANIGEVLAVSRGESVSAINKIQVNLNSNELQIRGIEINSFSKEHSLVHDWLLADNTGKYKKSLWIYDDSKTALYMPYYGIQNGYFTKTIGVVEYKNGSFNPKKDENDSLPFNIKYEQSKPVLIYEDYTPETAVVDGKKVAVNSVARIGSETFSAVLGLESNYGFLLKGDTIIKMPNMEFVIAVTDFPINSSVQGLAVATYGNGLLFSADTGKTWKNLINQSPVGDNLKSIRCIPSVLRASGVNSLIAYKISKDAKITIEVFSYDMKKVRTIVKNSARSAHPVRSTNPNEDFWDGKDDYGRHVALGTYYIKVSDNNGNVGWGKVMSLGN
jgi:hypothetical protein